jgi:oligoribonuclease (3'-5' exoribonuclease)
MATETKLSENKDIKELLEVLENHGLSKEKNDVSALVSYIENMENKLSEMNNELHEMYGEVTKIRNSTLHAKCAQLLSTAGEKIA